MMFATFFLILVVIGAAMALNRTDDIKAEAIREKSILFVNVEGPIRERRSKTDFLREMLADDRPKEIGLMEMEDTLKEAAKDKNIKGVYLRLRWVEAGWAKLDSLRSLLKEFKKSGKFIYAYSEAYDEKLYYLATVADEIFMYPKGEFEWNGIYIKSMFFKKTLGKLEVEPTLIRAGRYKSAGEMIINEKMSDENRYQLNELTQAIWQRVVATVAEDRQMDPKQLNEFAQNLTIATAQDAFNYKFVTELVPIEEVEKRLLKASGLKEDEPRLLSWSFYNEAHANRSSGFMKKKNQVAVVLAEGEIQLGSGSSNEMIYSDELSSLIRDLAKDDDVKALVLRIDSPGGSALASDVIWRSIEYFKKKKKVVSSFSDIAASGGYYIAANSDFIYSEPTTITGSIGVFGIMMATENFFDHKLGITFDEVKTHASADMMTGRKLTPFEHQKVQEQVNDVYKTFLNVVSQGRKPLSDEGAAAEVAEGRVWSGLSAKKAGLVDEFGSLQDAVKKAAEISKIKDYEVVVYPHEKRFFDKIFNSMGGVIEWPKWMKMIWENTATKHAREERVFTRVPYLMEY